MRRGIALLVLLVFAAAMATPALAACRMRAAEKECCCSPAPSNSLCAPDCCPVIQATRQLAGVSLHARNFVPLATPLAPSFAWATEPPALSSTVRGVLLVGLHERAAPRLPLRV
jgi:hypothetical protein